MVKHQQELCYLPKKKDEFGTHKHKRMAFSGTVKVSSTQKRQLEMDWFNLDRCLQFGKTERVSHAV